MAEKLKGLGISCGDIVGLMMLNTPEAIILLYALNKIGTVSEWLYFTNNTNEIVHKIKNGDIKWFVSISMGELDYDIIAPYVKKIITVSIYQSMPLYLKAVLTLKFKKTTKTSEKIITWNNLQKIKGIKQKKAIYKKDSLAVIVHTGGTTGLPKGVMLSNDNLNSVGFQTACNDVGLACGDKLSHAIPPFVAFGISLGTHLSLTNSLTIIMTPNPDPEKTIEVMQKYQPNAFPGGPVFVEEILKNKKLKRKNFEALKIMLVGGESLTTARELYANDYLKEHGSSACIQNGYGMTETSAFGTLNMHNGRTKMGSLGIPNSHTIISIFNPDTGEECSYEEEGEICISGPTVMLGYYNNPRATAEVIKEHNGRRWMHSGDIGYMDEDGFVFFTSQMKRLYIVKSPEEMAAVKVFPALIENVIEELEGITLSCVVATPDEKWISRIVAFVQLDNETISVKEMENKIVQNCKDKLPAYSQPSEICFVDKIPLTIINKKDFRALEKQLEEQSHK